VVLKNSGTKKNRDAVRELTEVRERLAQRNNLRDHYCRDCPSVPGLLNLRRVLLRRPVCPVPRTETDGT
jgi:hypothetical protein